VTTVVPSAATVDAALELAARIAAMPPLAVRAAKAAVLDAADRQLSDGLARERAAFFALFDTDDQAEGWPPSPRNARPLVGTLTASEQGGRPMEQDSNGGSDAGRDFARDLGDEPAPAIRDSAPDFLAPIDADAPVSGTPAARADVLARRVTRAGLEPRARPDLPGLPAGRDAGPRHRDDRSRHAGRPFAAEPRPAAARRRAGELPVVYTIDAGAYDIVVNGDHLLSWGVEPSEIQDARCRTCPLVGERALDRRGLRRPQAHQLGHGRGWDAVPDPPPGRARAPRAELGPPAGS
jgi:hypothetical protein